jgi:hypothetical protein
MPVRSESLYIHRMVMAASPPNLSLLGPHCRALRRGVIGDSVDGRSREGKFLRKCEAELVAQVGGAPSFAQKLLIRRIARAMLKLELFDAKMAGGNWTDHDARTYGGLSNSLRLMLRELGLRPGAERPKRLADLLNRAC